MRRCLRGFLHLALCGVEHGQIVVRLWQVGEVTCQRAKDFYGQIVLLLFCGDHTLQKAHMYVVAVAAQVCLRKRCRFGQLALGHELIDFGDGRGGKACAGKSQGRQCQTGSAPARQRDQRCIQVRERPEREGAKAGGIQANFTAAGQFGRSE